jgi:predicted RNA polymerase sigma factor
VWRLEAPKLVAALARVVRDLSTAEDLAQEALVAALTQWPVQGIPRNPGAWLMTAAKHRAIDGLRRQALIARKHDVWAREIEPGVDDTAGLHAAMDDDIGDNLLRLIFVACHPVLSTEARAALTLRLLGRAGCGPGDQQPGAGPPSSPRPSLRPGRAVRVPG